MQEVYNVHFVVNLRDSFDPLQTIQILVRTAKTANFNYSIVGCRTSL